MSIKIKIISFLAIIMIVIMGINGMLTSTHAFALDIDPIEVVMFGKADKKSYISGLKSSLYYADIDEELSVPVLNKSRKLKKCFTMKQSDVLVIPAGKTLTLTGGADIAGTIYIEKGGKLLLERYSVTLTGSVLCDGRLSVTGGTLYCDDGSLLYIGEKGSFMAADRGGNETELNGRIDVNVGANVVCFGETNIPDPTFAANPVAAVYQRIEFGGYQKKAELVDDVESLMPSVVGFDSSLHFGDGDFGDSYTILFSGGSCVKFYASGSKSNGWSDIGGFDIQLPLAALKIYAEYRKTDNR